MVLLWFGVFVVLWFVFCFFVGLGCSKVASSHLWAMGMVGFLVWAVFLFALGWDE
jgi:hypothetical protein